MRAFLIALVLSWVSVADAAPQRVSGTASCAPSDADAAACFVSWSWDVAPRAYQWVQVFEPSTGQWRATQETAAARRGRSLDTVEPGYLYRVVSCDDPQDTQTCIGTSTFWALLRPAIDDIPPNVVDERGTVFSIGKNLPYEIQLGVYNYIHQIAYFRNARWSEMPPMTRPERRWDAKGFRTIDNVYNNVYDDYERSRLPKPASVDTVAAERPIQWIGDVPSPQRTQFRAARLHGGGIDEQVIEFGPQAPKYTVTVFADIGCQHCVRMVHDLDELTGMGIRLRFLAFPLKGAYSAEGRAMSNIWCAQPQDRPDAFRRGMLGEHIAATDCRSESVLYQYALAKRLGLAASPSIINDDGEILGGYSTPDRLLAQLQERSAPTRSTPTR